VVIEIDIPAGCRPGTRILCRNAGHEWKPKCFQDIAFIIEETAHDRFIRLFDDLIMQVRVPWVDSLKRQGGKVPFVGIDGRNLVAQIDYPRDKNMKGRSIIKGAGMPIREGGQIVGRGNLVIQCVSSFEFRDTSHSLLLRLDGRYYHLKQKACIF
jgi:DnaJ-class molecular chaperone